MNDKQIVENIVRKIAKSFSGAVSTKVDELDYLV